MALSHNWLSSLISIIHLQQFLLQAVHPTSSPLLQLPHITEDVVKAARAIGVENITQFGKLEAGQVEKVMVGWSEKQKRDVFEVAKNWPVTSVIDAKFKGESLSNQILKWISSPHIFLSQLSARRSSHPALSCHSLSSFG